MGDISLLWHASAGGDKEDELTCVRGQSLSACE